MLSTVDELVPGAVHGHRGRFSGVLEDLQVKHGVHPQRSQYQQVGQHERRGADDQQRQHGDYPVGQPVLADGTPGADHDTDDRAQHRAEHQQSQTHTDPSPQLSGDRLAVDRLAEVAVNRP